MGPGDVRRIGRGNTAVGLGIAHVDGLARSVRALFLATLLLWTPVAYAEEPHDHSLMDPQVDRFLQSWKQPRGGEQRTVSCCNNHDCDEVETRPINGTIEFKSRVSGKWTVIPPGLLEQNQQDTEWSPNGKAWVCQSRTQLNVLCATLGDPGI